MHITSLSTYCHPPSPSLTHSGQLYYAKPIFQEGLGMQCGTAFLWGIPHRERCVSCRCFLHTLARGKNLLPLGMLIWLSTVSKMWLPQTGLCCLTGHHFAKLLWGHSLQPSNPEICLPDVIQLLFRAICKRSVYQHEPDISERAGRNPES